MEYRVEHEDETETRNEGDQVCKTVVEARWSVREEDGEDEDEDGR